MRDGLECIVGCPLSHPSIMLAGFPISQGGLGIAEPQVLLLPAFLAAGLTASLANSVGLSCQLNFRDMAAALDWAKSEMGFDIPAMGKLLTGMPMASVNPTHEESKQWRSQEWWSEQLTRVRLKQWEELVPVRSRVMRALTAVPHAGDWLNCPPSDTETLFSSQQWQYLLKWRLGLPLADVVLPVDAKCPKCFKSLDIYGDHILGCTALGIYQRHNEVRDTLANLYRGAGYEVETEVCLPQSDDRPADVFIHALEDGTAAAVDVSIVHPLQASSSMAEVASGTTMAAAVQKKQNMYKDRCRAVGWEFHAVVGETTGAWSKETHALLFKLTARMSMQGGASATAGVGLAWYKMASALSHGVAKQLSRGVDAITQVAALYQVTLPPENAADGGKPPLT